MGVGNENGQFGAADSVPCRWPGWDNSVPYFFYYLVDILLALLGIRAFFPRIKFIILKYFFDFYLYFTGIFLDLFL